MRTLLWYFWEFARALYEQLESDQERWGDEWKHRPIESQPIDNTIPLDETQAVWAHQNARIYERITDYYVAWREDNVPIPWTKVAGLALIGWVREYYPNYSSR